MNCYVCKTDVRVYVFICYLFVFHVVTNYLPACTIIIVSHPCGLLCEVYRMRLGGTERLPIRLPSRWKGKQNIILLTLFLLEVNVFRWV
jgi:hypothetical protein